MASVFKRGKSWVLKHKDITGNWLMRSLGPINDVDAHDIEVQENAKEARAKEMAKFNTLGVKRKNVTYDMLKGSFLDHSEKDNKMRTFIRAKVGFSWLERFLIPHPQMATEITPDVLLYVQRKARDEAGGAMKQPCGRNRNLGLIIAAMRWAETEFDLPLQNWRKIKMDPEPKGRLLWYDDVAFGKLLGKSYGHWITFHLLGGMAGMRPGEIAHARFDRINWSQRSIEIRDIECDCSNCEIYQQGHWRPKNQLSYRWLPLPIALHDHLKERAEKAKSPWIIANDLDGHRVGEASQFAYYSKISKAAGVRGPAYALRHTFASHWMLNGGDIYRLSRRMGHSSVTMTEAYAHMASDEVRDRSLLGQQVLNPNVPPQVLAKWLEQPQPDSRPAIEAKA